MKKQFISLCMAWWAVTGWASPHTFQVSSPDRNYVFTFTQEEPEGKTRMYYTLSYKGKEIVRRSELGVEIETNSWRARWVSKMTPVGTGGTT